MTYSIDLLDEFDDAEIRPLEDYFWSDPTRSMSLHPAWARILCRSLRHKSYIFRAHRDDKIHGYLMIHLVKSLVFGRYLVSSPYLNYGGPVSNNPEIATQLADKASWHRCAT